MTSDKCMDKKQTKEFEIALDTIAEAIEKREDLRAQTARADLTVTALAEKFFKDYKEYLPENWKSVYYDGWRITQSTQIVLSVEDFKNQFPFLLENCEAEEVDAIRKKVASPKYKPTQTLIKKVLADEYKDVDPRDLLPYTEEHTYPCAVMTMDDYLEVERREAADEHPRTAEAKHREAEESN